MKILLINVCLRDKSPVKIFPIGLGYIATALKNAGFIFDLLDIDMQRLNDDQIELFLDKKQYDAICLGTIVTGYKIVKNLLKILRKKQISATIIVGNTVASSIPNILLEKTEADVAVMGEGDITIIKLLEVLKSKRSLKNVLGICYKDNGQIIKNRPRKAIKDIDTIPFIDYSIFDTKKYIANTKERISDGEKIFVDKSLLRNLPINSARGCISNCTFCYHAFRGFPYRFRSTSNIIQEIKFLIEEYDINHISFSDELTLFNKKRALQFANAIIDSKLKFYWQGDCRAGLFIDDNDIEIIEKLKESGCYGLGFSLENASDTILKAMNKNITIESFNKQASLINKVGINIYTSLVFGYPQETKETIKKTFDICIKNNIYPSIGYLLPQPGSVMYDYAIKHNFIEEEEEYLLKLGDRQDLRLNMTKMSDEEFHNCVLEEAERCNKVLGINLDKDKLIKTQYYRKSEK